MLDEAYKNAGDKALVRMYIDWGLHRATTYDPLAALDIIRLIDSGKIKPGGYMSYNPIIRKFSPMKGAGNPVGFAGASSCKDIFAK